MSACAPSSNRPILSLYDHPLIDRIWDVKRQVYIDKVRLRKYLLEAEYLLLGENHDNQVHHQNQAWVIQQLQQAGRRASVSFEMIDDQQGAHLANTSINSVSQLIDVLNRTSSNWNYEYQYQVLFTDVMKAGYPIIPANLNRQRLRQLVKQGEVNLPKAYQHMLQSAPLSRAQQTSLYSEINESHCHMLDDRTSKQMVLGQRIRDALMAHSMLKNRTPLKVLIAGAGHVRNDRGVPIYLAAQSRQAKIVTLGLTEVEAGAHKIAAYHKRWGTQHLPFDFVWFTPRVERADLCAKFKQRHRVK